MINRLDNLNKFNAESRRRIEQIQKLVAESKKLEIERQERTNELLEMNVIQNNELLELKKLEIDFLKSIDSNTAILVELLIDLEKTNMSEGNITQEDMLLIKQKLDEIVKNTDPTKITRLILEEAKKKIVEKGVNYGIQYIIMGIKLLIKLNEN